MNLYCLPYAGGSASVYKKWEKLLGGAARILPIELPGRGRKFGEPPLTNMDRLVSYVLDELQLLLNPGEKYGLLGHSLGAMLAYKSAVRMEQEGITEPSHLFVSGVLPPHAVRSYVIDHGQQADDLIGELVRLGGIPAEVLAYPELLRLSLPVIRSDLQAHNEALSPERLHSEEQGVVKCDMTVFYGRSDPLTAGDMGEWRRYAGKACRIEAFEGGHFFIQDKETQITEMIASILRNA